MGKTKVCPTCGEEHNNKRSDYCCREIKNECLSCGNVIATKCNSQRKIYCNRKCSALHKKNKCLICGDPAKEKYCRKEIIIVCKTCKKEHKTKCNKGIPEFCSSKCVMGDEEIQNKVISTQIEKYGALGFNTDKQQKTMLERYGYITPAKNKEVKAKTKETQLKNNNGVWAFNTPQQKKAMMDKYGSLGRLGDSRELKRQQETMMKRYGVLTPSEHPEFLRKAQESLIEKYGQIFNNSKVSKVNLRYAEMLENELGVKIEFEYHIENSFFDLYLPEHNIAIEINPTVTHNSTKAFACRRNKCEKFPCDKHKPLDRNYHYNRAKLARDNDVSLIQVYEWDSEEDIISTIKDKIHFKNKGLSNYNLEFKNIANIKRHQNENVACYGLLKGAEIVATAFFHKTGNDSQWEMLNYDIKGNYLISSILNQLIEGFIEDVNPNNITFHIDFSRETDKHTFLNDIGFKETKETGSKLMYHNDKSGEIITTKLKYNQIKEVLDNNFVSIYTAGHREFIWTNQLV